MINIVIFNDQTGKIVRCCCCSKFIAQAQCGKGESFISGSANDTITYVSNGNLLPRPTLFTTFSKAEIAADTTDVTTLIDLPDPCTITYTGPGFRFKQEITGGTAEFTTDTTGTHTVKVIAFPYLDWEGTFDAV